MQFDTTLLKEKFPLITEKDLAQIQDFFSNPQTQTLLTELESKRKKLLLHCSIGFPALTVVVAILVYVIYLIFPNMSTDWVLYGVIAAFGFAWYLAQWAYKKISKGLKNDILWEMFKRIDPNFIYGADVGSFHLRWGQGGEFAKTLFVPECVTNGLLVNYEKLEPVEDFSSYDIKDSTGNTTIDLLWFEVTTTVMQGSGKHRHEVVNNSAYMVRAEFLNPKTTIPTGILITRDKGSSFFGKLFGGNTNKVQLENLDFEAAFDVYCADPLEARMLLTPAFMERLLNYSQKLGKNRVYEFYFQDNYFFAKNNLLAMKKDASFAGFTAMRWWYLEFSPFKSFHTNLTAYVAFVQELKYIQTLATDLKLMIYDKTISTTQVISPTWV